MGNLPLFMQRIGKRLLVLGVSAALLAYALKDVAFADIGEEFRRADYRLIALVGLITLIGYVVRGLRWQQPLRALGYSPTVVRTTVAIQTGSVSSMIVVGSGEITRCLTLQRTDRVPVAQGIGSVVAERIIDLFMLALVLLLTVLLEFARMQAYLASLTYKAPGWYIGVGLVVVLVLGGLTLRWLLTSQMVQQHPLTQRVQTMVLGFGKGFMAIRHLPNPGLFIGLTILGQLLAWSVVYVSLQAVDATRSLPPTAALTILAVSSLGGIAVPTQGGIGTYHFLVSRALVLYGFTTPAGAVIATFLHTISFGINLLLSSLSFIVLPQLLSEKRKPDAGPVGHRESPAKE